jgi:hypothetical protein
VIKGWVLLAMSLSKDDDAVVVPSTNLIKNHVPATCTTVKDILGHISVWAKEFKQLQRKGAKFNKLNNGDWDFDVAMDMMFSFWILRPIPRYHPKRELLREAGICYSCTCPDFQHYHRCKQYALPPTCHSPAEPHAPTPDSQSLPRLTTLPCP